MKFKYIFILLILLACVPLSSAANWTYTSTNTSYTVDFVNSTYARPFMYYLAISNNTGVWEIPFIGMASGVMGPFTDAFGNFGDGKILYVVLWFVFILMVWRNSGKVTIPAIIGAISAGAMGLLMPEFVNPYGIILLGVSIGAILITTFAKED